MTTKNEGSFNLKQITGGVFPLLPQINTQKSLEVLFLDTLSWHDEHGGCGRTKEKGNKNLHKTTCETSEKKTELDIGKDTTFLMIVFQRLKKKKWVDDESRIQKSGSLR